ncbi:hypothetical protein HDU98_008569 [Podochytrium sp. JEL0797]|nr:hypothetical protein HDU98_008569 [Podochytrium sp. JEL0797]
MPTSPPASFAPPGGLPPLGNVPDQQFWESAWSNNRTNWDLGGPTPALVSILTSHDSILFPSTKHSHKVLIPGVGRGYDLVAFAQKPGLHVVGLDISATGIEEAKKELARSHLSTDRAEALLMDFFEFKPTEPFDVVYDHTFLCAIHPTQRLDWSNKMASLTAKNGHLICYMFPLRDADERGPPFALSEEIYDQLLGASFEKVLVRDLEESEALTKGGERERFGGQKISLWKRRE